MPIVSKRSLNWNANDSLGTNNGTATNVTYNASKTNQGWDFNGSSSYVTIADSSSLDITWNITLSAIINPTTLKNSYFFVKDGVTAERSFTFDTTNYVGQLGKLDALFFVWGLYSYAYTTNQNVIVAWKYQHVAVTWTGSDWAIQFWINWNKVATSNITQTPWTIIVSTAPVYLWRRDYLPSPWYFSGKIDEAEIHNGKLSDWELKTKYAYLFWFM